MKRAHEIQVKKEKKGGRRERVNEKEERRED